MKIKREAEEFVLNHVRTTEHSHTDTQWWAYENHDLESPNLGALSFLAVGPQNKYKTPPVHLPDTDAGPGWRYVPVGVLNVKTGIVIEKRIPSELEH